MSEFGESFRVQGFLPADATDVRVVAQLDGDDADMRWTSPTVFASEHCIESEVDSGPEIDADRLPETLPDDGLECGGWIVVRSGDEQYAWNRATSIRAAAGEVAGATARS